MLPDAATSNRYSRQRKRTRSSTRALRKLHDTGMFSTLRTDMFTPLARAILRSSSDSDNRPDVTSTSRRNVESRPTSAANSESIRDRRKESGSDGGFGATVRWSESEDGFTPAGISARCAGQSTGRVQRSKNASVYRRFIGLDQ